MPSGPNVRIKLTDGRDHIAATYCGPGRAFNGWPADMPRPALEQATFEELRAWMFDRDLNEMHVAALERAVAAQWTTNVCGPYPHITDEQAIIVRTVLGKLARANYTGMAALVAVRKATGLLWLTEEHLKFISPDPCAIKWRRTRLNDSGAAVFSLDQLREGGRP